MNFLKTTLVVLSLSLGLNVWASKKDMRPVVKEVKNQDFFNSEHDFSGGLTVSSVKGDITSNNTNLSKFLTKLEKKVEKKWFNYVMEKDNEEYSDLTKEERLKIANNPHNHIGSDSCLEYLEAWAILKDGTIVGYVLEYADHVQATIYQDGAGTFILTDENFRVITTVDWSA